MGRLIVISAPSGAGKTSIVKFLLSKIDNLYFSISACSRKKRKNEINGQDYFFLSTLDFKKKIDNNEFLEWEEVYKNNFYGTLKKEVDNSIKLKKNVIFDVDVIGGLNIKRVYKKNCLSIFIAPPSLDVLESRLHKRGSESIDSLLARISKAKYEMKYQCRFDEVIINRDLDSACFEALKLVLKFIR
ncbi:MAG: guanylate kinase [Flavobacteriales bacterium]|nr:guanylate kinase [Flavobacteriales bacterium]|tara:strand:- start:235 stop:795 length:561 start_codon:yes stop_codon:yes gene_type:complete